jgi:hypothetical protein
MIQAVLLIALGFLTACLIGVLVAPALWYRASRLSRKQLEQTLPVTLSEVEAAQDQLRASYAVRMRRLETALAAAKQKAAVQLVDNSRLQMQIVALKDQLSELDRKLSERDNAATVLEQTLTRRFPELDREITGVKKQLQERSHALQELSSKLNRRTEELDEARRAAASYEDEVGHLRTALEKNSADRGGRRLKGASKWTLDDYRSEYDRLNLELSKLRQQVVQLQERDAGQASVIKGELHKLTELILTSAQPKAVAEVERLPAVKRAKAGEVRRDRPVRWTETAPNVSSTVARALKHSEGAGHAVQEMAANSKADAKTVLQAAQGTEAAAANSETGDAARAARSKLLVDAITESKTTKDEAAPLVASASPDAGKPVAGTAANGSGVKPDAGAAAGEPSAKPAASLTEKLREAGEEAV